MESRLLKQTTRERERERGSCRSLTTAGLPLRAGVHGGRTRACSEAEQGVHLQVREYEAEREAVKSKREEHDALFARRQVPPTLSALLSTRVVSRLPPRL